MSYDDYNEHPFAVFLASEAFVSAKEKDWLRWINVAEKIAGHSLDGDQDTDGYSLDGAYDAFEAGLFPEEYLEKIAYDAEQNLLKENHDA